MQGGEGRAGVFLGCHPCPEPCGMSGHAAWLILLSSGLGLPAGTGGFGQGWAWAGSKRRGGGDGGSRWKPRRSLVKVFIIVFSAWFCCFVFREGTGTREGDLGLLCAVGPLYTSAGCSGWLLWLFSKVFCGFGSGQTRGVSCAFPLRRWPARTP